MTFAEMIRTLRFEKRMTQQEFAELLGTSKQNISRYEKGDVTPMATTVSKIADILGVSIDDLMGVTDTSVIPIRASNLSSPSDALTHQVRLISRIAAGYPIPTEDEWETVDAPAKADYALTIKGDSMSPDYMEDDIVYIRATDSVEDGSVAAVLLDDSATLKRVYHIPNGIQLVSLNPRYAPMVYIGQKDADTIRIFGVPVGFTRMFT